MPPAPRSNVEIKARARDWRRQLRAAAALRGRRLELKQEDTFFRCPGGRLKLRELGGGESQLILYRRSDRSGPKRSDFWLVPLSDAKGMKALLREAYGAAQVVRKRRTVFLVGQSRLHFDRVAGLGRFLEIEVCLKPGQSRGDGERVARDLMDRLGIRPEDLLEGAYADLLKG